MRNFERFCKDYQNIENYEKAKKDNFVGWNCHHRKGIDISKKELKALGMYYNRPAEELIFLTLAKHTSLHMKGNKHSKGKKRNEETRNKRSEASKGNKNPMYGKKHSDKSKKKMSEAQKGENNQAYGKHWFNNGKENKFCFECPPGYKPGMLKRK